jgi:hypothetical protein
MNAIPGRRRLVAPGSILRTSGHGQHLTTVARNASTQAGILRHEKRLQSGLTQRDMWVMHSQQGEAGRGAGIAVRDNQYGVHLSPLPRWVGDTPPP